MKNPLKFIFLLLLALAQGAEGRAQNLVPNPSFEEYSLCPTDVNQMERAIGWYGSNTPDYFNSCDTFIFISVPQNFIGFQYPATGNAYAGIECYWHSPPDVNIHEFLGTELINPLQRGKKYFVSFKASFTINSNPVSCIAINKLGAKFSSVPYNLMYPQNQFAINNFAHVFTDSIITDTSGWVTISGRFIADSAYHYINIGNFFDDSHTDTIIHHVESPTSPYGEAYYYIDDVLVIADTTTQSNTDLELQDAVLIAPNPAKSFINISFNTSITNASLR